MKELFTSYESRIIFSVGVIVAVVLLYYLTKYLHRIWLKIEKKKYPNESGNVANLIKRILNVIWLLLGITAFSFIFVEEKHHETLKSNFELILYLGVLTILTIVAATSINMWFKKTINKKVFKQQDPTSYKFLRYVIVFTIYFVGIIFGLMAFPSLRGVAKTALGGAGVLAIVFGIASQEALSNVIGGIFIISFKPFRVGDLIQVTDSMVGVVSDITLRHTVIRNFDNKMIVIPNAIINKERLVNYDLGELKCCERMEIGISHDSDIDLAKKIMQEECENHPLILDNRDLVQKNNGDPVVKTAVTAIKEYTIVIRAWVWARSYDDVFELKISVLESIKKRFDIEGIEIPSYRGVVIRDTQVSNNKKDLQE